MNEQTGLYAQASMRRYARETMDHRIIARGLLAVLCAVQGLATLLIDLSHSHATNREWPRHARFHVVWQAVSVFLLTGFEVALIWSPGLYVGPRFYLAAVLTCVPMLAFLIAFIARKRYDGSLSDPNGIPPLRLTIFGAILKVDINLSAELAALIVLLAILVTYG